MNYLITYTGLFYNTSKKTGDFDVEYVQVSEFNLFDELKRILRIYGSDIMSINIVRIGG